MGFLFLFMWLLVAQCPQQERKDHHTLHSASWKRWGHVGTILQWSTLAACISIPLLEIPWRILRTQHFYGSVYIAESTIQTVLSFIFILKIFLNVSLSQMPRLKLLGSYSVPLFSLLIGTSLGIMNVVQFAFSETITGRFLRATEMYFLIIHSLVLSFHQTPHLSSQKPFSEGLASAGFSSEKPFLGNSVVAVEASGIVTSPVFPEVGSQSYTRDSFNCLQARNIPRRFSQRPKFVGTRWALDRDSPLMSSKPEGVGDLFEQDVHSSTASHGILAIPAVTERDNSQSVDGLSDEFDAAPGLTFRLSDGHETHMSLPSVKGGNNVIYYVDHTTSSLDSFDKLILQQKELDKSIATLRILSPPQSPSQSKSSLKAHDDLKANSADQDDISDYHQRKESTSGRSDFSLSNFPRPPILSEGESGRFENPLLVQEDRDRIPFLNTSDEDNGLREMGSGRIGSATIQYDVTSLAGGNEGSVTPISERQWSDESTERRSAPVLKPMFLLSVASQIPSPIIQESESSHSAPGSSKDGQPLQRDRDNGTAPLRPLLLGTATPLYLAPSFSTLVPIGSRRNRQGSLAPRPLISLPRPSHSLDGGDADNAYERPRAPPVKP
ncbi:hypothetical protein BDQ17DRAFT_1340812 [Cyathus striatus]|nr:hypothetical protein BDQ17DRAFT_1340812 [Cyathus striatus]